MIKQQGLYFSCVISGFEGAGFSVSGFELDEAYSSLYTLNLTLISFYADIDINALLLSKATFSVYANGILERRIEGIITKADIGKTGFHRTFYTVIIRPRLWLMTQRQNSRIFHHKTLPDVLSQLLDEHHVPHTLSLTKKHTSREYITQKRETDYDFFARLAAEEGMTFWSYFDSNQRLIIADEHARLAGGLPVTYNPHPQNLITDNVIHELSLSAAMTPQKFIGKDRMYENPAYDYKHHAVKKTLNVDPDYYAFFESYARFPDDEMGEEITDWRLKALQVESEQGKAKSNCIALSPGCAFILSDHPNPKLNASWQIVRAVHKGTMPQALEEDADGQSATITNELTFMSSNRAWHAPFRHKPIVDGPEVAEITGPAGEEICVNEFGQVKVFFHWNRYDKNDDRASCWVRVSQGWSGHGYGFYAIPRIGEEVIVSYLDGDIDRPLITGCVYNGNMNRPINMPDNKTQTVFRTKTHKGQGFNELRFDDKTDDELLHLHAQKNMDIQVRNSKNERVDYDRSTSIGHDEKLVVANNRAVSVEGEQHHATKGNYLEKIDADKQITIAGDFAQQVNGVLSTSSTQDLVLQSDSKITLRVGGNFMTIDAGGINLNGNDVTASVFTVTAKGSPAIAAKPLNPFVLKAAQGAGMMFVEYCPATGLKM